MHKLGSLLATLTVTSAPLLAHADDVVALPPSVVSPTTVPPGALAPANVAASTASAPQHTPIVEQSTRDEKSPAIATALALGTTAAGVGIMLAPLVTRSGGDGVMLAGLAVATVGPSIGHFYSGEVGHGLLFTGLRAGALVAAGVGLADVAFSGLGCAEGESCGGGSGAGGALFAGGLIAAGGLAIYDIADAHNAANRANARARGIELSVVPQVSAHGSTGMALVGRF